MWVLKLLGIKFLKFFFIFYEKLAKYIIWKNINIEEYKYYALDSILVFPYVHPTFLPLETFLEGRTDNSGRPIELTPCLAKFRSIFSS